MLDTSGTPVRFGVITVVTVSWRSTGWEYTFNGDLSTGNGIYFKDNTGTYDFPAGYGGTLKIHIGQSSASCLWHDCKRQRLKRLSVLLALIKEKLLTLAINLLHWNHIFCSKRHWRSD